MKTIIEGVEITPQIAAVLKNRYDLNPNMETSTPEHYAEALSNIQDFLCYLLEEENYADRARKHLVAITYIKDDFKQLIPRLA